MTKKTTLYLLGVHITTPACVVRWQTKATVRGPSHRCLRNSSFGSGRETPHHHQHRPPRQSTPKASTPIHTHTHTPQTAGSAAVLSGPGHGTGRPGWLAFAIRERSTAYAADMTRRRRISREKLGKRRKREKGRESLRARESVCERIATKAVIGQAAG